MEQKNLPTIPLKNHNCLHCKLLPTCMYEPKGVDGQKTDRSKFVCFRLGQNYSEEEIKNAK